MKGRGRKEERDTFYINIKLYDKSVIIINSGPESKTYSKFSFLILFHKLINNYRLIKFNYWSNNQ